MKHVPKENTDDALIQEFLNKGGKVSALAKPNHFHMNWG